MTTQPKVPQIGTVILHEWFIDAAQRFKIPQAKWDDPLIRSFVHAYIKVVQLQQELADLEDAFRSEAGNVWEGPHWGENLSPVNGESKEQIAEDLHRSELLLRAVITCFRDGMGEPLLIENQWGYLKE